MKMTIVIPGGLSPAVKGPFVLPHLIAANSLMALSLLGLLAALAGLGVLLWRGLRRARLGIVPVADDTGLVRDVNLAYVDGDEAHPVRHRLDVYAPANGKKLPVLLFVHGGGWVTGHKSSALLGIYDKTGETLARLGVVVVMANYRLSPWVRHPAHVEDVAKALVWTRKHAERYGGDPDNLFVGGHSAGGHLAALLATDPAYLAPHRLSPAQIRGCLIVSGVYRIGDFVASLTRIPVARYFGNLGPIFGADAAARSAASPITHVSASMPPFLVLHADSEWYQLDRQAADFVAAARGVQATVESRLVPERNHVTIMSRARHAEDPVIQAAGDFIRRHGKRAAGWNPAAVLITRAAEAKRRLGLHRS